jgi:hypothetical protein
MHAVHPNIKIPSEPDPLTEFILTTFRGMPSSTISQTPTLPHSPFLANAGVAGAKMSALHLRCAGKLKWQAIAVAAQSQSVAKERRKGWLIKRL